jgi:HNH endonuclease
LPDDAPPTSRPRHPLYQVVADRADYLCEYCLAPEELSGKEFQVEHVVPRKRGGGDSIDNLALACIRCNLSKATALQAAPHHGAAGVPLFNPRKGTWSECFSFDVRLQDQRVFIRGRNDTGRATVSRLKMNAAHATTARWKWFEYYSRFAE